MPRHVYHNPFIIRPSTDLVQQHPELRRLSHALSLKYAYRQVVTEEDLQIMGRTLWSVLGVQGDFDAAHKAAGAEILPVVIESNSAEVQALPWETLHHPALYFLGKHAGLTLSRRIQAPTAKARPPEKGPLRVLLFTSLPDDVNPETGRLNVEEEQAQIQEALMPWIGKGVVQLEMPDDGRFATLKELLVKFHPHLLFLSGHGRFHHEPHSGEAPYGEFLFESESGGSEPKREEELAKALVGMSVRSVVVSTCESSKAASDALSNGLTQRLSAQGIPHVIGMRESVLDRAGILFARAFCDEVVQGERIDTAVQRARIVIQTPLKGVLHRETGLAAAEELSLGQWCLPMLLTGDGGQPLIDWDFAPVKVAGRTLNQRLDTVSLPERFVGRRAELRQYKSDLLNGKLQKLLITGPGGQGKTSLAGKLAIDLLAHGGYRVFAWSTRPENPWRNFELEMELSLDEERAKRYDRIRARLEKAEERAPWLLDLLLEQFNGRVVLFLDNLESLQDPETLKLTDPLIAAWLKEAARRPGVILLVTSRWRLPEWSGEHLLLERANYGDFLQMAQRLAIQGKMSSVFLGERERLRKVYDSLGGNCRGLEFFAAATREYESDDEENAFMESLARTKAELREYLVIGLIYERQCENAKCLLHRLPAFREPVPLEGIVKIGLDLSEPEMIADRLSAVSLLEVSYNSHWDVTEYVCTPLVADWLNEKGLTDNSSKLENSAADYYLYLFINERPTLSFAMIAYQALRRAQRNYEADILALDYIVEPLAHSGFYVYLLKDWLPQICQSTDLKTRGDALGWTGRLLFAVGDYAAALEFLTQSCFIHQQIGNKAGEGTALNNIASIYHGRGDYETALSYLKQSLAIRQQIGDKDGEGATINNISQIYKAKGDYSTALSYLKASLAIYRELGNIAGEGTILNNIANIYHTRGDYETALGYLKQSLSIHQKIANKASEGTTLNNIANIYQAMGDYETALAYLKQSLTISQQISNKTNEGITLNNIANIFMAQADYERALDFLKQSLAIHQQIGNKSGEGTVLNNISQIFDVQNDFNSAINYLTQSLAIAQQIGNVSSEEAILNNIANAYDAQKQYPLALEYLKKALALHQLTGNLANQGNTTYTIAQIYLKLDNANEAKEFFTRAKEIFKQLHDKGKFALCLIGIGNSENILGNIEIARWSYKDALDYNDLLDTNDLSNLLALLGILELRMGFFDDARKHLSDAKEKYYALTQIEKASHIEQILQNAQEISERHAKSEEWAFKIIRETTR